MTRRRRGPALARTLAVLAVLSVALVACDAGTDPGGSPSVTVAGAGSAAPTSRVPTTAGPLVVDPGLLAILPDTVHGATMQAGTDAATNLTTDAALGASASAVAVGTLAAPGSANGGDFATSTVVQLRPGVYSDGFYADWRKAYDEAACAPAGGVQTHLEQQVGRHAIDVTLCAAGARTYHAHLDGDILVSVTAIGDARFGALVMAGLRR